MAKGGAPGGLSAFQSAKPTDRGMMTRTALGADQASPAPACEPARAYCWADSGAHWQADANYRAAQVVSISLSSETIRRTSSIGAAFALAAGVPAPCPWLSRSLH
jgi:hypothetical protein